MLINTVLDGLTVSLYGEMDVLKWSADEYLKQTMCIYNLLNEIGWKLLNLIYTSWLGEPIPYSFILYFSKLHFKLLTQTSW